MAGSAAATVGATAASSVARAAGGGADLIFRDGTILTMIDDKPEVAAVAVKDGKIRCRRRRGCGDGAQGRCDQNHRP